MYLPVITTMSFTNNDGVSQDSDVFPITNYSLISNATKDLWLLSIVNPKINFHSHQIKCFLPMLNKVCVLCLLDIVSAPSLFLASHFTGKTWCRTPTLGDMSRYV
jgi:hypothetical protein